MTSHLLHISLQWLQSATDAWQTMALTQRISFVMPFGLSAISAWQMYLTGKLHRQSWLVGMFNQSLWLVYIVISQTWGFIPMNVLFWIVMYKNHQKWKHLNLGIEEKVA